MIMKLYIKLNQNYFIVFYIFVFTFVLQVRSDVTDAVPAGGHQGYAALGGLYTQCRPLVPHLYGSVEEQWQHAPVSRLRCVLNACAMKS